MIKYNNIQFFIPSVKNTREVPGTHDSVLNEKIILFFYVHGIIVVSFCFRVFEIRRDKLGSRREKRVYFKIKFSLHQLKWVKYGWIHFQLFLANYSTSIVQNRFKNF